MRRYHFHALCCTDWYMNYSVVNAPDSLVAVQARWVQSQLDNGRFRRAGGLAKF